MERVNTFKYMLVNLDVLTVPVVHVVLVMFVLLVVLARRAKCARRAGCGNSANCDRNACSARCMLCVHSTYPSSQMCHLCSLF